MDNVIGKYRPDIDMEHLAAGEFHYAVKYSDPDKKCALLFVCPCGCGSLGCLEFRESASQHPSWNWDGNVEKPTLDPSVQKTTDCKWHGHLIKGVWVPCGNEPPK